jgi:hypothetical protein
MSGRMAVLTNFAMLDAVAVLVYPNSPIQAMAITPCRHLAVDFRSNDIDNRGPGDLIAYRNLEGLPDLSLPSLGIVLGKRKGPNWRKTVAALRNLDGNAGEVSFEFKLEPGQFNFIEPNIARCCLSPHLLPSKSQV